MQRKSIVAAFSALVAFTLLGGCAWPTNDPGKLKAIRAESQMLMRSHPVDANVPKAQWPHTIASLEPEFVWIKPDGVLIQTKPFFDGGWGYYIPTREREMPEPVPRYEKLGQGIYWWHPY